MNLMSELDVTACQKPVPESLHVWWNDFVVIFAIKQGRGVKLQAGLKEKNKTKQKQQQKTLKKCVNLG